MNWGNSKNNDFSGKYFKRVTDLYTFIGYDHDEFHKYDRISSSYFYKFISKITIEGMFPEMSIKNDTIFNNWSIKYFKCNEYLIMRKSGYEYVFEFDLPTDINKIQIHKVSNDRYYFWCGGIQKGENKQKDYHINLEVKGDKIVFHKNHLREFIDGYNGTDDIVETLIRQIDIWNDKFNDLEVSKFDCFVKSLKILNKYAL